LLEEMMHAQYQIPLTLVDQCNLIVSRVSLNAISLELIKYLINAGVNPRYNNDEFLINSCRFCDIKTIAYLIDDCGCNINASSSKALVNAFIFDRTDAAKFLLDSNIKITPDVLETACLNKNHAKLLLDFNVDINLIAYHCITTKQITQQNKIFETINFLIDAGADLNLAFKINYKNQIN